jgi:hypothetical protein
MVSFTTAIMVTNVVLPQLMTSLRADLDQIQWVLTAPSPWWVGSLVCGATAICS